MDGPGAAGAAGVGGDGADCTHVGILAWGVGECGRGSRLHLQQLRIPQVPNDLVQVYPCQYFC